MPPPLFFSGPEGLETGGFPPKFRKNWKEIQPSKKIFIFS